MSLKLKSNKRMAFVKREIDANRETQLTNENTRICIEPVALTDDLIKRLVFSVSRGLSFEYAATAHRLSLNLFKRWMEIGAIIQFRAEVQTIEVSVHEHRCFRLFEEMRQSKAKVMEQLLSELFNSGDWRSKAWFLEKTGGEIFAKRETIKIEISPQAMSTSSHDFSRLTVEERKQMLDLFDRMRGETPLQLAANIEKEENDAPGNAIIDIEPVER